MPVSDFLGDRDGQLAMAYGEAARGVGGQLQEELFSIVAL